MPMVIGAGPNYAIQLSGKGFETHVSFCGPGIDADFPAGLDHHGNLAQGPRRAGLDRVRQVVGVLGRRCANSVSRMRPSAASVWEVYFSQSGFSPPP